MEEDDFGEKHRKLDEMVNNESSNVVDELDFLVIKDFDCNFEDIKMVII